MIDGLGSLPARPTESQEVKAKNKFKLIIKQLMSQSREGEHVFSFLAFGLFSSVEIALKQTRPHGIFSLPHLLGVRQKRLEEEGWLRRFLQISFPSLPSTLHFQNVLVCVH